MILANLLDPARASGAMRAIRKPLYSWSLGGHVPDRLVVLPPDPWTGDAGKGRWVANRILDHHGVQTPLDAGSFASQAHAAFTPLHSFEYLRDLRSLSGDASRRIGRQLMSEWIAANGKWREGVWDFPVTGNRIAHWLMGYDFFCASGDDAFLHAFYASLIRQIRHLDRVDPNDIAGLDALAVIRALIFAGLGLDGGKERLDHALGWLDHWIMHELDGEGMHVSRSPHQAVQAARQLIDIRGALVRAGYAAPTVLQAAIDRVIHAIRFFRMGDGRLACFHGTQEDDVAALDTLVRVSGVKIRKPLSHLEHAGFESLVRERTHVIADCGIPPAHPHDKGHHASPLSFEMSVGRDRMIVNCGTHPRDATWADHLRATAAHSGLTVDDRNAFEILPDGHLGRVGNQIAAHRDLAGAGLMVTLSHDGYAPLSGLVHTRRLALSTDGRVLEGNDWLASDAPLAKDAHFAIRFHLHPRVQASLIQNGEGALLRLPSGAGWRFAKNGGTLALEPSIYVGSGTTPRKAMQLVVSGVTQGSTQVAWSFSEES